MNAPDFSAVQNLLDARRLERSGKLVTVLLFPSEVGGQDIPENIVYITPEAAAARTLVIGSIGRYIADGTVDKMTVEPEYRGESFVPTCIRFHASHSRTRGRIEFVVDVW